MSALNLTKRAAFAAAIFFGPIFGAGHALAQSHLYLKGKRDFAANESWKRPPVFRLSPNRSHVLVEFARRPTSNELAELRSRVHVLSYVPDDGFEVSMADGQRLDGLPLSWIGRLQPEEKTSPLLRSAARKRVEEVVVEFHRDVTQSEKREVALRAGVTIHDRPDLLPNHLLVRGTPEQLLRLAAWDEVSYMFPASKDLKEGLPVEVCVGALTQSGPLGQSIPKIGDGWDGPGLGAATLHYAFAADSAKLPAGSARAEIEAAFQTWAQYAQLTFTETRDTTAPATLAVLFATGQHGDAFPFTSLGTLAHTYYPFPTNPEPIAGDMHFNDGENWHVGADIDLYSVALHETGHALGLGHSDQPGAVMYPYYKKVTGLSAEDIGAIQDLYAARGTANPGAGSGSNSAPVQPTSNNSGNTSSTPSNPAAPVNPTAPNPPAPPAPLVLSVNSPGTAVSTASLTLSGTVSGGVAPVRAYWITDQGYSGIIQNVSAWTASKIPIHDGANTIAVVAQDAANSHAMQILAVQRTVESAPSAAPPAANPQPTPNPGANPPATTPPTATPPAAPPTTTPPTTTPPTPAPPTNPAGTNPASTTPPSLDITSPFTTSVYTGKDSIVLKGTASDAVGIASIAWSTSTGMNGVADGTTSWKTSPISFYEGTTTITITATDTAGNISWRAIVVTRN